MQVDPTDEELMMAVKRGHVDNLGVLFARYRLRLFDFFFHMDGRLGQ
jgi:hypothetical protein